MEENFQLENCSDQEVLSFKDKVYKIGQVKEAFRKVFRGELANALYDALKSYGVEIDPGGKVLGNKYYRYDSKCFDEGIDSEILKLGSHGWQKGKFRITVTLEFIPDEPEIEQQTEITEPESPLDDLRRMINEES